MAKDFVLFSLTYFFLFSPPHFLVDNLGFAKELSTRKQPPPVPFFESSAWIDDYYTGDIYEAFQEAQHNHQDAFIMYYATWDADSQYLRETLETVAAVIEDNTNLYFAAVNCGDWLGECYKHFGEGRKATEKDKSETSYQLPVLVYYPRDRRGVQYSGPLSAHHILQFLLDVQNPIALLHNKEDFDALRAKKNGGQILVGYFPSLRLEETIDLGYRRFVHAAYQLLEYDPFRSEVGSVAAITKPDLAYHLHLNQNQPVRYFHWDGETSVYPNKTITSAASLIDWAFKRAKKVTAWMGVTAQKSQRLAEQLSRGTGNSLLVFLPRFPDNMVDPNLSIVQETAMRYHTCGQENRSESKIAGLLHEHHRLRQLAQLEADILGAKCLNDPWFERQHCHGQHDRRLQGQSCVCKLPACSKTNLTLSKVRNVDESLFFQPEHNGGRGFAGWGGPIVDANVHNARVKAARLRCSLLTQSNLPCRQSDPKESEETPRVDGLACSDNKTLNFYTIDSRTQKVFAKSLGLDGENDSIAVIIVNLKREVLYKMEGELTAGNLAKFITEFHGEANLSTLTLSSTEKTPNSNEVTSAAFVRGEDRLLNLESISAANFASMILQPRNSSHHRLLLYTSSACRMCASFAHVLHSTKFILRDVPGVNLTFYTVDAATNDLPVHFTALTVPTLLFFPAGNDAGETRAFPDYKEMNVPNVVSFLTANLPPSDRLALSLHLCDEDCLLKSRVELTQRISEASAQDLPDLRALENVLSRDRTEKTFSHVEL